LAIKRTKYRIFTRLSHGTVKVMKDPDTQHEGAVPNTASSELVSEGREMEHPLPWMTGEVQQMQKRKFQA
jgi:hypothetical protein